MTTQLPQLLPCPFCGGDPKYFAEHVYCAKCGCRTAEHEAADYAINTWNRRATTTQAQPVTRECEICGTRGYVETGITESPTTACDACNGSGYTAAPALVVDEAMVQRACRAYHGDAYSPNAKTRLAEEIMRRALQAALEAGKQEAT